jgi:hypothetical protein
VPVTATIRAITQVGDGCSVAVEYSDGSAQSFEFQPVPSNADVRARVKGEVARRNTIDEQVNRLQNLIGVVLN